MVFEFFQMIRMLVLRSGRPRIVPKLLSYVPLGRLAFGTSMAIKRASLYWGLWSQRALEYTWVLKHLKLLKPEAIVLDVGCAESLLSYELLARKYRVVGIDIREHYFKNKWILFIKRDILQTGLRSDIFDAIIAISTIEHIGLGAYAQPVFDDEGDIKTMEELYRILKPGGIIFITTPYIGNEPFHISQFERKYNRERLTKLVKCFHILKEEYFYPKYIKRGRRLIWMKLNREQMDKESFSNAGLACLILQKPNSYLSLKLSDQRAHA
jgi:SAM-dependent methyltransferase